MPTVDELLRSAVGRLREAGSESARLDAELLLARAIGADRTSIVAHPEAPVWPEAQRSFEADLRRRERGEPVAYIRGLKEFYGIALAADSRALIPRPETELLVELAEREVAVRLVAAPRPAGTQPIRIVDVGTGAGTIAVALAVTLRRRRMLGQVEIDATDVSADAIELARENGVSHGVADRVQFRRLDLFAPTMDPTYDLVLANLPYVPSSEIDHLPVAASFEPRIALDGGPDGLDVIRRLLPRLPEALVSGGVALVEIGADQAAAILAAVTALLPGWSCSIETDLAGRPRVARVEPPDAVGAR